MSVLFEIFRKLHFLILSLSPFSVRFSNSVKSSAKRLHNLRWPTAVRAACLVWGGWVRPRAGFRIDRRSWTGIRIIIGRWVSGLALGGVWCIRRSGIIVGRWRGHRATEGVVSRSARFAGEARIKTGPRISRLALGHVMLNRRIRVIIRGWWWHRATEVVVGRIAGFHSCCVSSSTLRHWIRLYLFCTVKELFVGDKRR